MCWDLYQQTAARTWQRAVGIIHKFGGRTAFMLPIVDERVPAAMPGRSCFWEYFYTQRRYLCPPIAGLVG